MVSHNTSGDIYAIEINHDRGTIRSTGALHYSEQNLPLGEYEIDELELNLNLDHCTFIRDE